MKCEICLEFLEEYLDGELAAETSEQIDAHLVTCGECSMSFAALTAEQELFTRYDRELEVSPFMWTRVAAHTVSESNVAKRGWLAILFRKPSLASAVALALIVALIGAVYFLTKHKTLDTTVAETPSQTPNPNPVRESVESAAPKREVIASQKKPESRVRPPAVHAPTDQSDVLSSDTGYLDGDDQDTAKHIEQTQILLRSIKNVSIADGDDEIDVTFDKALSRRLLNENVVLRRDAEMKAKFPTKTLLADLEPFLIDIANLPDHAKADDVRVIKERVQKTEIVAALVDYQDRGTNIVKE
ncbi:MAG TPA: zf-HC2 domain-containing protein [Pyrinomonadaceae bacterium]|nr:zf-HC2 domain-containing protein [Pyrinomonadaceae bacterium]